MITVVMTKTNISKTSKQIKVKTENVIQNISKNDKLKPNNEIYCLGN